MADVASGGADSGAAPDVSVVVCTYRREASLRALLGDLLVQRDVAAEIVVVDQTPEHEPETDRLLAAHPDRIRHLRVAEPNLPNARNEGLAVARAGVVVFVDDDLRVPQDFLAGLLGHFRAPEVEGLAPLVVEPGEESPGVLTERLYGLLPGWREQERIAVPRVIGACMALRSQRVRALGGFEPLLGRLNPTAAAEDYEFCDRWRRAGHRLWLAPGVHAEHFTDTPGGCAVREAEDAKRQQLRAMIFLTLKQEGAFERLRPRVVARLLRLSLLRRDVLWRGPRAWWRGLRQLREELAGVQRFWAEHGPGSGPSPARPGG